MGERVVETLIGAVVLIVAGGFFFYAYTRSNVQAVSGYELHARFGSIGSLKTGSDVRISGIKVGTVTREDLDPNTFLADVRVSIKPEIKIPDDSAVRIAQDGLLGDHYLVIEPGGSDDFLRPGSLIAHSQGAVDLLSLVGQAIFSAGGNKGGSGGGNAQPTTPASPLEAPSLGGPGANPPQSPNSGSAAPAATPNEGAAGAAAPDANAKPGPSATAPASPAPPVEPSNPAQSLPNPPASSAPGQ